MSLYTELQKANSEEDVKDAYIRALHLKSVNKSLIDIQTAEIWFEAKAGGKVSVYKMFTQLANYVYVALRKAEQIPPFLCVIDSVKAAVMETPVLLPLLKDKNVQIKWGKSASDITQEALDIVSHYIGTHFVEFRIETQEKEFIATIKKAVAEGRIIRTQITPDNLKQVFDRWVDMIGKEINGVESEKYCLLFFADIMSDGVNNMHSNLPAKLIHINGNPAFSLDGIIREIGNYDGYRRFWAIYDRPPEQEYRDYLLERRDSLIPVNERVFKGAYYTPLRVVEKAYELLNRALGKNWQRTYVVWDMCCGVGNLETKHSNHRNVFMSTLDQADIDVMKAARICCAAEKFQYNYLEDDITPDGGIDYTLTGKMPETLRAAIAESRTGGRKILVLINPPYAEATNADNTAKGAGRAENKTGVAKTAYAGTAMDGYGKATNELFMQFVARIAKEIPTATLAMFSKMKYVNATNFGQFRQQWKATFLDGFIVHSKAFDGLKGNFPIGFLIWKTDNRQHLRTAAAKTRAALAFPSEISCGILDKDANPVGEKTFYNIPVTRYLNVWIPRPRANKTEAVPLSNCITVSPMAKPRVKTWSDNAVAYMCSGTNDMQNAAAYTFILSSVAGRGNGMYVTEQNLWQCAVYFSVMRLIPHTWVNDRDQFLQPEEPLPDEFIHDCLVWMLFNGSNLTAGAAGLEWNNRTWHLTNHFIPYTEAEVNAPERFESDCMVRHIAALPHLPGTNSPFSAESQSVLDAGRTLWRAFFSGADVHTVRNALKLNRSDAGWYQIRHALAARNENGTGTPVDFAPFETAYKTLTEKLRPQVYTYGFLR